MRLILFTFFIISYYCSLGQIQLIRDVNSSGDSKFESSNTHLTINESTFFIADDGVVGYELWKTDGTEQGTSLVKDINSGDASSDLASFHNINGELLFYANDGVSGMELWKSDGTEAGTSIVKDIAPGATGSYQNESAFAILNNKLYFAADDGNDGPELWVSDGTEAGTTQLIEFPIGTTLDSPLEYFVAYNDHLFFRANKKLWISDSTTAGTRVFISTNANDPKELVLADNGFYFTAFDNDAGKRTNLHVSR